MREAAESGAVRDGAGRREPFGTGPGPAATQGGSAGRGAPLDGLRVVDFTRVFSGPFATQLLAALGAEVVKVERPDGGDEARDYGNRPDPASPGPPFLAMNHTKKSVAVDLKDPAGRAVARRLIDTADVLVENFRPGVMDRLGLGYDEVAVGNPALVYCSITGFGGTGPLANRAANDLSVQALSGLLSMTGEPDRPPVRTPAPLGDLMAGMFAAVGVLAALREREQSGAGQHVATSMFEAQLNTLNYFYVDYWLNGTVPRPMGTANGLGLPNQAFRTSDGWVCVTSSNERAWRRLCTALDIPECAEDPRFATLRDRYAHRPELVAALSEATGRLSTADCVARLDAAGVSNSPVRDLPEAAAEPQLQAVDAVLTVPVEGLGDVRLVAAPLHFSASSRPTATPPPALGADTGSVLAGLGYAPAEIADLVAAGTVRADGSVDADGSGGTPSGTGTSGP
ncbi:CaiB/BaiF CoA-transferase family protein [Streptomyces sp. TS71-3]|uniref:CaiB/BaiF CoA transferase family protein n=1 Tax=Streptomyces sp. TS71-3 TaxID=2733862 RepID=UPI001B1ABAC6|nr:CoA transferase [Streptomyces sp. TS71-3]GHJ38698.1 CoA transferase [Streptomyces sp. TS71-3]